MLYNSVRTQKGRSLVGFPSDFCVVDIETTGLSSEACDIIEIGAIKYESGAVKETFASLLQPPVREVDFFVSPFITNLTGITNEMLENAPVSEEVLSAFSRFLGDSLIVGYNVNFDVNFLYDAYLRYLGYPLENDFIDILRMARRLYPEMPHHRLGDMTQRLGFVNTHAHRALSDCEVTADCFFAFRKEAEAQYGSVERFLRRYPASSRWTASF